jgi:hypothetical protein
VTKTDVGGLPHGSYIVTDNSAVIAALNERIAELEKERDELHTRHYRIINYCTILTPEKLEAHNLKQQAKALEDFLESANIMWADNLGTSVVDVDDLRQWIYALLVTAETLKEQDK